VLLRDHRAGAAPRRQLGAQHRKLRHRVQRQPEGAVGILSAIHGLRPGRRTPEAPIGVLSSMTIDRVRAGTRKRRMRGWRGAALLGVALAALAATAPRAEAQYFGQNKVQYRQYKWKSISSDHFEVYFYAGLDSLAMRTLDLAE